jgi:hypothetical protein
MQGKDEGHLLAPRVTPRNVVLASMLLVAAVIVAACGGTTAANPPGTPGCVGTGTYPLDVSCHAAAWWSHLDEPISGGTVAHTLSAQPMGVYSNVGFDNTSASTKTLICDASCVSEHGFIGNYVSLLSGNLDNYVMVGVRADGSNGGNPYEFWGDVQTSHAAYHNIGPTGGTVNNFDFAVYAVQGPSGLEYNISTRALQYAGGTDNLLSIYSPPQPLETSNILPGGPNAIEVGEILHGTHGEAARWQAFTSPEYSPSAFLLLPANSFPTISSFSQNVMNNGHVVHDMPPYGNFFWNPTSFPGHDGLFYFSCCTTP